MDSYDNKGNIFQKDFDYPEEDVVYTDSDRNITNIKPKILIMGLRRSGKSSIQKVVFHKMSPNETLLLESTNKIVKDDIANNSFVSFSIWDFPSQISFVEERPDFDYDGIFKDCGALVFVIDSQDDYADALLNLNQTVRKAHQHNPNINFEVFIHKVDGLSDDHKIEARQEIHQRANEELSEFGEDSILLSFYLTSIYDHSIFEAFSKVVQKLIPQLPILENLLNVFISNSSIEKAFLFDVVSKIFIATDSSPVDMQTYELCCDMIDVVIDVSCIYGINGEGEGSTFDDCSSASIRLKAGTVLYLREVNKFLAMVCIIREENFTRQGLIDYNFQCFRQSIQEVFTHPINESVRQSSTNTSTPYGSSNARNNYDITPVATEVPVRLSQYDVHSTTNVPSRRDHAQRKMPIIPSSAAASSLPTHNLAVNTNSTSALRHPQYSPNVYTNGTNYVPNGQFSDRSAY